MTGISAQVSLYPLGQADIAPTIAAFLRALSARDVPHEVGSMSTVLWGDDDKVFGALREAFAEATRTGQAVLTVTISNACPLPAAATDEGTP